MSDKSTIARPRGDDTDEIIRLRDALTEAEYQVSRWIADAAGWERRADDLSRALAEAAAATPEHLLRQFHAAHDIHGGLAPATPTADVPEWVRDCRLTMLDEEVAELREAMKAGDIVKIADALADITCVVVGTAVPYGIPFDAVLAEVCRSNMTKTNTTGKKLVKGPGYEPPRIAEILSGSPAVTG